MEHVERPGWFPYSHGSTPSSLDGLCHLCRKIAFFLDDLGPGLSPPQETPIYLEIELSQQTSWYRFSDVSKTPWFEDFCPSHLKHPGSETVSDIGSRASMWRFPEMGIPLVFIHFSRIFPLSTTYFGYPHLWKPPCDVVAKGRC